MVKLTFRMEAKVIEDALSKECAKIFSENEPFKIGKDVAIA